MNHPHLVLQGGMDIDLERSPDIGMAQHLAQALDVHTLLHAARRIGVPQHMEISVSDVASLQETAEIVTKCTRFHRLI